MASPADAGAAVANGAAAGAVVAGGIGGVATGVTTGAGVGAGSAVSVCAFARPLQMPAQAATNPTANFLTCLELKMSSIDDC